MKKINLSILAKLSLVILSFLLLYYFYAGIRSVPWEGDSLGYHIPIAKLILSGKIINPALLTYEFPTDFYRLYQPGAIEGILSFFVAAKIPLNLFDVAGIIFFFFAMYKLGRAYALEKNLAIIFASSLSTLHTVMRWVLSQTIDVWLAGFFGLSLVLLKSPNKSWKYFALLGLILGFLFGGKYTGPAYFLILILMFWGNIIKFLNLRKLLLFLIPFSILGLFWYIRNLILTGDPYFPQSIPFFPGIPYGILDEAVWKMFGINNGVAMWLNGLVSEYTIWSLALVVTPFLFIRFRKVLEKTFNKEIIRLLIISLFCLIIYLFLPSGPTPSLITSVFRYTYVAFIPLILCIFLFAQKFKKEALLGVIAVTNMLIMPELSYHPKVLIALIPIALLIFREDLFPPKLKA